RAPRRRFCLLLPAMALVVAGGVFSSAVYAQQQAGICERIKPVRDEIVRQLKAAKTLEQTESCANVTGADLEKITDLHLENNLIAALPAAVFAGLSELQTLRLDRNAIASLPAEVFAGLSKLQKLDLRFNEITELPAKVFAGLTALQELRLSNNYLAELPDKALAAQTALRVLALEFNDLTELPGDAFTGMSELQELELGSNVIAELPMGVFTGLAALQILSLKSNEFTELPAGVFTGLSMLQNLNLTDNFLAALRADAFTDLRELRVLDLSDNALQTLPPKVFAGLAMLQALWLGDNSLAILPAGVFSGLSAVRLLGLTNNSLAELPAGVFSGMTALAQLRLQDNALTDLPAGAFAGLPVLRVLNLRNNSLEALSADVFAASSALQTLRLNGNPIAALQQGAFNGLAPGRLNIYGMEAPAPPAGLRLTPADRALHAEWTAADGVHYYLRWKPVAAAAFAPQAAAAVGGATYVITDLSAATTYEVQVAALYNAPAKISGGRTVSIAWRSNSMQGATLPELPGRPQNVRATAGNTRLFIRVTWDEPAADDGAPITGYRYRWSNDDDERTWESADGAAGVAIPGGMSALEYTIDSGLESGVTYGIQVAAGNAAGAGTWSETARDTPYEFDLDVNDSGAANAADGILVARYLFGVISGSGLVMGQADAAAAAVVAGNIARGVAGKALDADGDNDVDATDGTLVARYLLGLRGASLVASFNADAAVVGEKMDMLLREAE
ncbi:MAG: leucine-rich repeat domain-containing protein, partial [Gammaproteobacteria bacterium]